MDKRTRTMTARTARIVNTARHLMRLHVQPINNKTMKTTILLLTLLLASCTPLERTEDEREELTAEYTSRFYNISCYREGRVVSSFKAKGTERYIFNMCKNVEKMNNYDSVTFKPTKI